jgi:hypothetical protein
MKPAAPVMMALGIDTSSQLPAFSFQLSALLVRALTDPLPGEFPSQLTADG